MWRVWLSLMFVVPAFSQTPSSQTDHDKRDRATYNGAYDPSEAPVFNREPNAFLVECVKGRRPGVALDIGMGSGRNAIFLAKQGWDVTGFDIAEDGVRQAERDAAKTGLKLRAVIQDEKEFDFGVSRWDLIVLTYQPFRHLMDRIRVSLKQGGVVVVENFHRDTRRYRAMRPGGFFGNNELLHLFDDFRVLRYEDVAARPDWGIEFPVNRLVRILAQKGDPKESGCDWKGNAQPEGAEVTWGVMRLKCTAAGWEPTNRKLQ